MKTNLIFSVCFWLITASGFAQSVIDHTNQQLRTLFEQTQPPGGRLFMHEMSAKITDTTIYTHFNTADTINADAWFLLHSEVFNSAYDTTLLINTDSVFKRTYSTQADTVPLLVLDHAVYRLKPQALDTNLWFDFDTVNTVFTNQPSPPSSPFWNDEFFFGAPGRESLVFGTTVFQIGGDQYYTDAHRQDFYNDYLLLHGKKPEFRVNFDDGTGWHTFLVANTSYHTVTYATPGEKTIRCGFFGITDTVTFTQARLFVPVTEPAINFDNSYAFEGLEVYEFVGCETQDPVKTIFYLAGFDAFDRIDPFDAFHLQADPRDLFRRIKDASLTELMNFNYRYVIVKYVDSGADIRDHARSFTKLLERYKCIQNDPNDEFQEEFTVIGESMGGLVARYALTLMEDPDLYDPPSWACHPERMHNTRLMITIDAPHQGANVPLGVQYAYDDALEFTIVSGIWGMGAIWATLNQALLAAPSAQQMLKYHKSTAAGIGPFKSFGAHPLHYEFFTELAGIGNYPVYCKKVALVNGALDGTMQDDNVQPGYNPRYGGDDMFRIDMEHSVTILFARIPVMQYRLHAQTNHTGQIYEKERNLCFPYLKLYWFGISIECAPIPLITNTVIATNAEEICVNPGSTFTASALLGGSAPFSYDFYIYVFGVNASGDGNGCFNISAFVGLHHIITSNIDLQVCSQGLNFSFIPTTSAMDYNTTAVNHDIWSESVATVVGNTPFDVVIGWDPDEDPQTLRNHLHLAIQNGENYDETETYLIRTCESEPHNNQSYILNTEIGDEKMYLNNRLLGWKANFRAEFDMLINEANPFYHHPLTSVSDPLDGTYSKEAPFIIYGEAQFFSDIAAGGTFTYNAPYTGPYQDYDEIMQVCCQPIPLPEAKIQPEHNGILVYDSYAISVYPNPTKGNLTIDLAGTEATSVAIFDMAGKCLSRYEYATDDNLQQLFLSLNVAPGTYILEILHAQGLETRKIIVH